MTFESPEWFLLIPAFVAITLVWRHLALWKPLRAIALLCLTLALVNPKVSQIKKALNLYILLDRSESTEDLVDKNLPEWKRILTKHKPSRKDKIQIFNYASEISKEETGELSTYIGERKLTRTNLALEAIAAQIDKNTPSRVLLFTDGYATEPIAAAATKLKEEGVPLDYRLIREDLLDDYRIAHVEMPNKAQSGEPYVLGITIRGFQDIEIPLSIFRNDQLLTETTVQLNNGVGKAEFTDRISTSGSYQYSARIQPELDAHLGNNIAEQWIEITGGPKILLVSKYTNDPLLKTLEAKGFSVEVVSEPKLLRVGQLTGSRAVILNNVPAYEVPEKFQTALNFFVKEEAGGLLMIGGEQSFGSGGYFNSPIDSLLPVSMELKNEHRKLSVALAIVMDRSGSMGVGVGGGLTKMDLANKGAASAIELLGPMDQITVFAVDSEAHKVVPLTPIKNGKNALMNRVKRIKSTGGGIFVFTGLQAAWRELEKAKNGTKHIILFTDAADSEEPGRYKELIDDMKSKGCTISVIGLGTSADSDAAFIEDIAKRGEGRIFFSNKPLELPRIFAQETVTIARSAFIKDPVGTQATGKWSEISPKDISWLPQVDGYNLSYTREDATASLISTDEYNAPLIAHANRGLGRTMAVSFPLGGDYSSDIRSWPAYGDFSQTMTRWLMGTDLPPGIALRSKLDGTKLTVDLLYDTEKWGEQLQQTPPQLRIAHGEIGSNPTDLPWRRLAPGHFTMTQDMEEGSIVRGVPLAQSRLAQTQNGPLILHG